MDLTEKDIELIRKAHKDGMNNPLANTMDMLSYLGLSYEENIFVRKAFEELLSASLVTIYGKPSRSVVFFYENPPLRQAVGVRVFYSSPPRGGTLSAFYSHNAGDYGRTLFEYFPQSRRTNVSKVRKEHKPLKAYSFTYSDEKEPQWGTI